MTTPQVSDASPPAAPHVREPPLRRDPEATLLAAASRAAENWRRDCRDAVGPEEVSLLLDAIVAAVGRGEKACACLHSVPGRRLLDLVRGALIEEWRVSREPPCAEEMLTTLEAIESVRSAIKPDWSQYFGERLSQPDGWDLVVEVAHDFRSPLTSILFLAETLQRRLSGDLNELQHRQIGLVYSAALGLSQMASNMTELARGGSQHVEDEPSAFSVTDTLEAVCNIARPMAEEKGLVIRLNPPANDFRLGHPVALSHVLLNLTTNALKFTEKGLVEITCRETGPASLPFSVRDTGNGISREARQTLYSPFRRVVGADRYAFSSTGLGLVLCRKLVEAMGSTLRVQTKPGRGTRFHFDLELPPVDPMQQLLPLA